MLNLVSKIVNEKFASSINYNEFNVAKQSQKYSIKIAVDIKQSQNTQV